MDVNLRPRASATNQLDQLLRQLGSWTHDAAEGRELATSSETPEPNHDITSRI